MILPTMNESEKVYEVLRVTGMLCDRFNSWREDIVDRFRRGSRFPYIQRYQVRDDKGNDWIFLFICPSKEIKKKGLFYTMAYTTYFIPPRRMERDVNSGMGILIFDPVQMQRKIEREMAAYHTGPEPRNTVVMDIVPHAFNRYTERYLRPAGREDIEFGRKVESMLLRWQWFDVMADMAGDKNAKKHMKDNICPYDVIMRGGGMLRGQIVNGILLRFTTYVSEDMMYDNQIERQKEMVSEYFRNKRDGMIP